MYTIMGLYDYYKIQPNDIIVQEYLRASIKTIKDHILLYRVPGHISYYCLKHNVQSARYHLVHINQLSYLCKITGDTAFYNAYELFKSDYSE